MNKEYGVSILRNLIDSGVESTASIARSLNISQSQVSRIASGNFKKMTGNALNVCNFAYSIYARNKIEIDRPEIAGRLNLLAIQFVEKNPEAAQALIGILEALSDNKGHERV